MKRLMIIGLLSCMSVMSVSAFRNRVEISAWSSSRSSSITTRSGGGSSVSINVSVTLPVLIVGGYALADYFEKIPNFLSVRHGINLLRGNNTEDVTLQDVCDDFKKVK